MPEDRGGAHAQGPVIVRRKKVVAPGHHGGAWKVAYADMVTALMALFIVLWILSSSEAVKQSVASYFAPDPIGFEDGGVGVVNPGRRGAAEPASEQFEPTSPSGRRDRGEGPAAWGRTILDAIAQTHSLDRYHDQIELSAVPEGLRIELLESDRSPLFVRGSTALDSAAHDLLLTLGAQIAASGRSVVIEGHTDSALWRGARGRSNWDLSTERAHAARRVFAEAGVGDAEILEVRGLADRHLYNPNDPTDARNRRVSITLLSDRALARRRMSERGRVLSWSRR